MPIINILIFFATFIIILMVGLYIFISINNSKALILTNKFIIDSKELKPIVFQNIKIFYRETGGLRKQVYINNSCDLYLFDNFLSIVRRQDFLFKVIFPPILISSDIRVTKKMFDYLDSFKPDRINFKQIKKGDIDIKLTDPIYKYYITEITLKGVSNEFQNQHEKIKTWCV